MNYNFINNGVIFQNNALTPREATQRFHYSCNKCMGRFGDCEHCAIESAYQQKLQLFRDIREAEEHRRKQQLERKRTISQLVSQASEIYIQVKTLEDLAKAESQLEHIATVYLQKFDLKGTWK